MIFAKSDQTDKQRPPWPRVSNRESPQKENLFCDAPPALQMQHRSSVGRPFGGRRPRARFTFLKSSVVSMSWPVGWRGLWKLEITFRALAKCQPDRCATER